MRISHDACRVAIGVGVIHLHSHLDWTSAVFVTVLFRVSCKEYADRALRQRHPPQATRVGAGNRASTEKLVVFIFRSGRPAQQSSTRRRLAGVLPCRSIPCFLVVCSGNFA